MTQTKKRCDANRLARKREIVTGEERNVNCVSTGPSITKMPGKSLVLGRETQTKRVMSLKSNQIALVRSENVLTASDYVRYCTKYSVNLVYFTWSVISGKVEEKRG